MKKNKKANKIFGNYEKFFYAFAVALGFTAYILMPGCGGNKSTNTNPTYPPTCLPGQICTPTNPYQNAQGIPLINGPTYSALDQQGSQLTLTWAAPQYAAGQAYNGPVNVSGSLRIAPGACANLPSGGEFQVQGQGNWASGYAGALAAVQANLTVVGGGYANNQYNPYGYNQYNPYQQTQYNPYGSAGGSVSISQSLIYPGGSQGGYTLSYGYGVYVSMCNRTFAFYN
ncbi:MAG: hypothetical protein IPM57_10485 [Oligoflexia bacterium]|nr:hypothetical protein [Oligoflexia bacterium]